ncbi:MAG: zinc-ribbon domain-containing protein [Candidatus Lokiarchaeota archaeon]|nr:zinc-ribbon domain-containing protein [Candidatus Lokiarchaeota archaeon]
MSVLKEKCQKCGAKLSPSYDFCLSCGTKFSDVAPTMIVRGKKKGTIE